MSIYQGWSFPVVFWKNLRAEILRLEVKYGEIIAASVQAFWAKENKSKDVKESFHHWA